MFSEIAVSSLPDIGEQFYKQCLKFHTSTNMTEEEIHNLGLEEVVRIEKEMMDIVVEMGYSNLTLQQFSEMIRLGIESDDSKLLFMFDQE